MGLGKHTAKYWESRLVTRPGVTSLYCRLTHQGAEHWFNLHVTDRKSGGEKARDIWLCIQTDGITAALEKYKPKAPPIEERINLTLGEYIKEARGVMIGARVTPWVFERYCKVARRIVGDLAGLGTDQTRYGCKNQVWVAKVETFPLADFTPEKFNEWCRKEIQKVVNNPKQLASTRRTLNSYISQLRGLFHPEVIKDLPFQVPHPLCWEGVKRYERGSVRYFSKVDGRILLAGLKNSLKSENPEAYKCGLLALCAGLRRREIDLLEWRMIHAGRNCIQLEETEFLRLKSPTSRAEIEIDPETTTELLSFKPASKSKYVISGNEYPAHRKDSKPIYRCDEVFEALIKWLRSHGITERKPIHTLRKELGAMVSTQDGIYAASRILRHATLNTTVDHYVDHTKRISVGLGSVLGGSPTGQQEEESRKSGEPNAQRG